MSKIKIDQYNCCTSEDCLFSRECSQHYTAGDFRAEDGFTPEITSKDDEIYCASKDKSPLNSYDFGCIPENYDDLGSGMKTIKEIPVIRTVLFSELQPGERFEYMGNKYTKVSAQHLAVSDGIKAVLKEKCLLVSDTGYLVCFTLDFLVTKL